MMIKHLSGIPLLFVFLMFISCGSSSTEWDTYVSSKGGFSIRLPKDAKESEKEEMTPFGKQKNYYIAWKPSNLAIYKFKLFQVSFTNCPSRVLNDTFYQKRMLDSSISMRIKDFTENDVDAIDIEWKEYKGKTFILDIPGNNSIVVCKQIIANHRRYDLTVITKKNYDTNKEVNDFFNSFNIIK